MLRHILQLLRNNLGEFRYVISKLLCNVNNNVIIKVENLPVYGPMIPGVMMRLNMSHLVGLIYNLCLNK